MPKMTQLVGGGEEIQTLAISPSRREGDRMGRGDFREARGGVTRRSQ